MYSRQHVLEQIPKPFSYAIPICDCGKDDKMTIWSAPDIPLCKYTYQY